MAFDASRSTVMLFGGSGFRDTWEWDGASWHPRSPQLSPPGNGVALVYEAARQRVVLFCASGDAWFFAP